MIGNLSRTLYTHIIRLYPEPFQHQFGQEMLSVFDECRAGHKNVNYLLADGVAAAFKQQWQYLGTPVPAKTDLYSEVPPSPILASRLATVVLAAVVLAGVFLRSPRPKAHYWTTVRIQHEILYLQTAAPVSVCPATCLKRGA